MPGPLEHVKHYAGCEAAEGSAVKINYGFYPKIV